MSSAWILTWQCAQLKRLDILCCKRMTKRPIAATTLHTIKLCIIKLSFISIYTLYPELEPKSCQLQHLHKYCLVKFQIISSFTTKKKKKSIFGQRKPCASTAIVSTHSKARVLCSDKQHTRSDYSSPGQKTLSRQLKKKLSDKNDVSPSSRIKINVGTLAQH